MVHALSWLPVRAVVVALLTVVVLFVKDGIGDGGGGNEQAAGNGRSAANTKHLEIYKRLFSLKRKEQVETAEKVWDIDDYAKQYKTITFVLETIFPILNESMARISEVGYTPDSPFPEDQDMQEAVVRMKTQMQSKRSDGLEMTAMMSLCRLHRVLGKVYENVVFFGDFVLRMPDMTKKIYRKHKEWFLILKWAVGFCNKSSGIFVGPHATQLHLLSQEIGLIPEEPNYVNPFRAATKKQEEAAGREKQKRAKKNKRSSKGPKLRGVRHSEL